MMKAAIAVIVLNLLILFAQDSFLENVRAEDLTLDRLEVAPPNIADEIVAEGTDYWFGEYPAVSYSGDSARVAIERTDEVGNSLGIWVENLLTGQEIMVSCKIMKSIFWSPSGRYLSVVLFELDSSMHYDGQQTPKFDSERLCIYDAQAGDLKTLVFMNGITMRHSWSPSDDFLAYSYFDNEKGKYILAVLDAEGNTINKIDELIMCDLWNFSWSPHGNMIAYSKPLKMDMDIDDENPVEAEIFVVNSDGSGKKQITNTQESELFVKWLPDGQRLIIGAIQAGQGLAPKYYSATLKKKE